MHFVITKLETKKNSRHKLCVKIEDQKKYFKDIDALWVDFNAQIFNIN